MAPLKRILVPVDFSECSRLALRRADDLAKAFDATLDLVHVWRAPEFVSPEVMIGVAPQGQTLAQYARQQAEKTHGPRLVGTVHLRRRTLISAVCPARQLG